MRSIVTLILILPALLVFGQDNSGKPTYYVSEGARDFVSGTQNALIIELPGVEDKMAEKVWKNYIDKFGGKTKKMKEIKGTITTDTEIYPVGGLEKMNLYSRVEETKEKTTVTVWFELKSGMVRSDDNLKAYTEAVKFMQDYGLQVNIAQVEETLEAEEKNLKNLERDMEKLKRDNTGYHRDIEVTKERIAKAEKQIEENVKDQGRTDESIKVQQEKVKEVQTKLSTLKR